MYKDLIAVVLYSSKLVYENGGNAFCPWYSNSSSYLVITNGKYGVVVSMCYSVKESYTMNEFLRI